MTALNMFGILRIECFMHFEFFYFRSIYGIYEQSWTQYFWVLFYVKKLERLRSELLSEDKITNLLGFWQNKTQEDRAFIEWRTLLLRSLF